MTQIKIGTVKKDATSYGNKYWIQIEDTNVCDNQSLDSLVDKPFTIIIADLTAIDDLLQEQEPA
jgi:hypothetical protein